VEPFDDPLAGQFATFREDTLGLVRPAGAADARHLYEHRHRTRVLTVAVGVVAAAVVTAGGGFALADHASGTIPAEHRSASPSPTESPSTAVPSAPPPGGIGGVPSDAASSTPSVPANVRVTSATAIGVNTLWAVGYAPCTGHAWQACPAVLSSHDAGHTWSAIAAPGTAPYTGEIRFANNRDGWVVAQDGIGDHEPADGWGVVYATHDGGASWHVITTLHQVTNVEAAAGQVWATTSGGDLFTAPVGANAFTKIGATGGDGLVVHGRYAYTYPTAWATPTPSGRPDKPALTVAHSDGTTSTAALPCPADTTVDLAMSAGGDTKLVLVCGQTRAGTGQDKTAFASSDAGTTWTALGTPDHAGLITSVASCAAGTFLAGRGMPLRATRDGGATWPVVLNAGVEGGYRYVGFTDDKHGFALAGGASVPEIRMTADGGHTWSTYSFDNS